MAVRMAVSANDLAQICAPAKTATVSADGGAEFKNILRDMRESRRKTAQTVAREPKTPVNFAFLAGEADEITANAGPVVACPAEPETTPDAGGEAAPPSRFDPDVFLEALEGAVTDKRGMDAAKDAEEDGDADTEAARETAASDSDENKTRFTAPALPVETNGKTEDDIKKSSDEPIERTARTEKNVSDLNVETNDKLEVRTNGKTEDDVKKSSDEPAEHPARTEKSVSDLNVETSDKVEVETNGNTEDDVKKSSAEPAEHPARTEKSVSDLNVGTSDKVEVKTNGKTEAGAKKLSDAQSGGAAAEDASSGTRPGESQNTGADELPDTDISDDAKNTDHKDEPGVPKAASRASGTAQRAGGQEDAASGKAFQEGTSREKMSPERAAEPQISAANPFAGQARAETAPLAQVQAPAVYTLMSADKFGEGLRSVMTIMTRDGAAEARIVVEPPALGRVDISLRASESGVEANFKVDNEELRQMVQKQLDSLKESLNAQGIHVSGITVDIKNNEGEKGRGKMGTSKKSRRLNPGAADEAEENIGDGTRILRLDLEQGLLHWVA